MEYSPTVPELPVKCLSFRRTSLCGFEYKETELLELLNIERSTFYDRKKEAILLFGLSLWETSIPKLKQFLEEADSENEELYTVRYQLIASKSPTNILLNTDRFPTESSTCQVLEWLCWKIAV